jgi:hypothetical protein
MMKRLFAFLILGLLSLPSRSSADTQFKGGAVIYNFFYKFPDSNRIYMKFGAGRCYVMNPAQLDALKDSPHSYSEIKTTNKNQYPDNEGQYLGNCMWPNGMYRLPNKAEVYRIKDSWPGQGTICWVRTSALVDKFGGWNRVRTVNVPLDNLKYNLSYSDRCSG